MSEAKVLKRDEVLGAVVSDKMDKTITVKVFRKEKHPKYGKYIKKFSTFKAHDEKNAAKEGDKVRIVESKPLSKSKRWRLIEVIEKARSV